MPGCSKWGWADRLDAVNAVDPTVAVVVSIGLDHQEFLGTTLGAIAVEKAGIFRKDRPAVLGSRRLPTALMESAESVGAIPKRLGTEFDYSREPKTWRYRGIRWDLPGLPPPALRGATQFDNAATAIAALEELERWLPVLPAAVARGLESVRLTGRFQIIAPGRGRPVWILDVAHNPDAADVLARNLRELPNAGRSFAICEYWRTRMRRVLRRGFTIASMRGWLAPTIGARGTDGSALAERIRAQIAVPLNIADSIPAACAAALAAAAASDRIVVFGSFHTVGPALEWLESQGLLPAAAHSEYT